MRIRNGRIEYLEPFDTYAVIDCVVEGPDIVNEHMDGMVVWAKKYAPDSRRAGIQWAEGEGCLIADYDNKVVIFFGGDIECSYWSQQSLMEGIASAPCWQGWDVRWAYKGLLDATRYLGQEDEYLDSGFVIRIDEKGCNLLENTVTADVHRASSIIAVKADDKLVLYPLDTMFPEYLLYYGERNLVSKLDRQGRFSRLRFDDYVFVRGFLFDEDSMTATYWGLCCELVPRRLEEGWPNWKAVDLEGDRQGFECIVSSFMDPTEDK